MTIYEIDGKEYLSIPEAARRLRMPRQTLAGYIDRYNRMCEPVLKNGPFDGAIDTITLPNQRRAIATNSLIFLATIREFRLSGRPI